MRKLSEPEKKELINCIKSGEKPPQKYLELLFPHTKPTLEWAGKTKNIDDTVIPLLPLEKFGEDRGSSNTPHHQTWSNKLIWGDNLQILPALLTGGLKEEIKKNGGIKLIYIDPPFDVGSNFSMNISIGSKAKAHKINLFAYKDSWGDGEESLLSSLYARFKLMHQLLAEDGSIYVHCDWRMSGQIRMVLDEIFGPNNHRNEICWVYNTRTMSSKWFARKHDTIFLYSKSANPIFNIDSVRVQHKEASRVQYNRIDDDGRSYKPQSFGKRTYLNPKGQPCSDVWNIQILGSRDRERLGYPTQKPSALLKRIIKASSNEGDIIADFYCGSGVLADVATQLGRKWICSDIGLFAINTTKKRALHSIQNLKDGNTNPHPFHTYQVPKQYWYTSSPSKTVAPRFGTDDLKMVLKAYGATLSSNDGFFQGQLSERKIHVVMKVSPFNVDDARVLIQKSIEQHHSTVDVLSLAYDMEALFLLKSKSTIEFVPKYIPFNQLKSEYLSKGPRFNHCATLSIEPHVEPGGLMRFELINLSYFSAKTSIENAQRALSNRALGKLHIINNDNLYRLKKNKDGGFDRLALIEHWLDWIDHWAIDINYNENQNIFNCCWSSFRYPKNRSIEHISPSLALEEKSTIAIKIIDIFGQEHLYIYRSK
jgi:DNA modification methylase